MALTRNESTWALEGRWPAWNALTACRLESGTKSWSSDGQEEGEKRARETCLVDLELALYISICEAKVWQGGQLDREGGDE